MSTQGVLEGNKITSNKITSNHIELNKITSNKITSNKITSNSFRLASNELITTADGRELLSYVIGCAIPSGTTLVAEYEGVTYEFEGDIGLAPSWLDRDLRETDQRWVSACLIARVNLYGIPVAISIRGPHKALKVSETEAEDYLVEEAAFYGNVFTPAGESIVWNACRGRDQAAGESGGLELRDCSEPDPSNPGHTLCGFTYAGDCADWAAPRNAYACKKFRKPVTQSGGQNYDDLNSRDYHGGYYEQCYDSPGAGHWQGAERYTEIITVFVAP